MATIKIQRTSELIGIMRDYKIFINGQKAGTISNGKTKHFAIPTGQHTISAKVDWLGSPAISIDIKDNETKNITIGGFKYGNLLMISPLVIMVFLFCLSGTVYENYIAILIVPLLLIIIYYLIIRPKEFLTIKEI